jgi:hemerythrin-like domain-containing protein
MQARGPLMIEHRLIERMIGVIQRMLGRVLQTHSVDPSFVDTAVDFIRVYADRTHHGKEEDILFRELRKKRMSSQDRQLMDDLVEEHIFARVMTKALVEANSRYRKGDEAVLSDVTSHLDALVSFYPKHILKEDKTFFPASRLYFSDEEDRAMLAAFWEFDRQMIHEKYQALVRDFESRR